MDLKQLQEEVNARWSKQLGNPCHQSAGVEHALIHLTKALGKLASILNDAQHEERKIQPEEVAKYLADLVICASRFAEHSGVNLNEACDKRLSDKFSSVE